MPTQIANAMLEFSDSKVIFYYLDGSSTARRRLFHETVAAIIILTPILVPVAMLFGFNPVHIGIMVVTLPFADYPPGSKSFCWLERFRGLVEKLSKPLSHSS
ncbi:TRAP transporter large permease subunit [Vibrio lentus]|nr:TRAP transporter large permease subunit [Vibrio lentus]